ncbi:MAG TPA: ABC transporter ATP-binding protein [Anaerolineae bacterium]|nr:ABC transporter ATP-binding protein [Anaerolineae bacterium]
MSSYVELENLTVDVGTFQLKGVDLHVQEGEYFVILGPTGAGKTVLLETIAGLYPVAGGEVWLAGKDVTHLPPEKRNIGFVYQDYVLFPHLSVRENIAFGLKLRKLPTEDADSRVETMASLVGTTHLLNRRPDTLSGGEKQRVALARALITEPRLLLLDEPLSALDPERRETLQRELWRIHQRLGTTTIHVTHDFEEAVALGDRIAVMNEGQIVQIGSPEEIFRKPSSEFVARFVGVRNIFRGEIRSGEDGYKVLPLNGVEIAVVTGLTGRVHASIRPEEIVISREPLHSSARNSFRGRIVNIANRGAVVYVTVRVPFDATLQLRSGQAQGKPPDFISMITRRSLEEMELREGLEVYIAFKASAVHVF